MTTRRQLIQTAGMAGTVGAASLLAGGAALAQESAVYGDAGGPVAAPAGRDLTPDQALDRLREGNRAFLEGGQARPLTSSQRRLELARGQQPFAAYVTYSDSRVPPELLFDGGLGELFIIRNAGNTVDTVALGSIEYAVAVLGVPMVVVMGHESCGAVAAAASVVSETATYPGQIGRMIEPIIPAVLSVRDEAGDPLENAVRANVRRVAGYLRNQTDPIMQDPLGSGRVKVVGAYYNLETGAVDFFDGA